MRRSPSARRSRLTAPPPPAAGARAPEPGTGPAATWRVLAAAVYDGLLLLALLMVVTAALHLATHGEAITRRRVGPWQYAYSALLLAAIALYFGIPWTRRGQTLAMKAWRLRLECTDGSRPGWSAVLRRLAAAVPLYLAATAGALLYAAHLAGALAAAACALPLLASHAWQGIGGGGTLPDRVSGTRIVLVPKEA
jgi:uncharacterized RDD family membrane protein YckC